MASDNGSAPTPCHRTLADRSITDRAITPEHSWLILDPAQDSIIAIEAPPKQPIGLSLGDLAAPDLAAPDLAALDLALPIPFDRLFTPTTTAQIRLHLAEPPGIYPLTVTLQSAVLLDPTENSWGAWLHWDGKRCRLDLEPLGDPLPITALAEELAAIASLKQAPNNHKFWSIVQARLQILTGAQVQLELSRSDYGPPIGALDQGPPAEQQVLTIGPKDQPWAKAIIADPQWVNPLSYQQRVLLVLWANWVSLEFANHLSRQRQDQTEAICRTNEELARSNRELESFAYAASHDLKEPLRGIHNYLTFLLQDYGDVLDAAGIDQLQTVLRLSKRMDDLIDALLQFAKLGQTPLNLSDVALQDLVEWVIELIRMSRPESPFKIHIVQPLPIVHCDRVLISEVFTNLISNALKYNDQPPQIEIGCQSNRIFYVRDNGIGIRDRHLGQIFRLFKRLHPQKRYGGGTGAGLTLARKIIEGHGGQIWVESEWGQGSTFYFCLGADRPTPDSF
jgi:signal transduction histidine kinase